MKRTRHVGRLSSLAALRRSSRAVCRCGWRIYSAHDPPWSGGDQGETVVDWSLAAGPGQVRPQGKGQTAVPGPPHSHDDAGADGCARCVVFEPCASFRFSVLMARVWRASRGADVVGACESPRHGEAAASASECGGRKEHAAWLAGWRGSVGEEEGERRAAGPGREEKDGRRRADEAGGGGRAGALSAGWLLVDAGWPCAPPSWPPSLAPPRSFYTRPDACRSLPEPFLPFPLPLRSLPSPRLLRRPSLPPPPNYAPSCFLKLSSPPSSPSWAMSSLRKVPSPALPPLPPLQVTPAILPLASFPLATVPAPTLPVASVLCVLLPSSTLS